MSRLVIVTTTSHVTQRMGGATSGVPRAGWETVVTKFVLVELLVLIVKRNVIVTIVIVTLRRGSVFVKLAQEGGIVINHVTMELGE